MLVSLATGGSAQAGPSASVGEFPLPAPGSTAVQDALHARAVQQLTTAYGSAFTDAKVKYLRCADTIVMPEPASEFMYADCDYDFGTSTERRDGAVEFSGFAPTLRVLVLRRSAYGLGQRSCHLPRSDLFRSNRWEVRSLRASNMSRYRHGCLTAAGVIDALVRRAGAQALPRKARLAPPPYNSEGGDPYTWTCTATKPARTVVVRCVTDQGRRLTTQLRRLERPRR